MTIWFTADTHFGHANIIKFCGRPFETKEEHDEVLVNNWNSVVEKGDTVYHLGDFFVRCHPKQMNSVCSKLKGQINLILGNHDKASLINQVAKRFGFIKQAHLLQTKDSNDKLCRIFLSHYAHRTWCMSNHGSYHLFGHSHGNMPPYGLSFDVGVDCWNYTPISLDKVVEVMNTRQMVLDYIPKNSFQFANCKQILCDGNFD